MLRRHKNIAAIVTLSIIACVFASIYYSINSSFLQTFALNILNRGSYFAEISNLKFQIFPNTISIKNLRILNKKTKQAYFAKEVSLKYNLLGLLQGKIRISHLDINGFEATLSAKQHNGPKSKLNFEKLLILQNISIEDGKIEDVSFIFPNENKLIADTLLLTFVPHLSGKVSLKVNLQGVNFNNSGDNLSVGNLILAGETKLKELTNISGSLKVQDFRSNKFSVTNLSAQVEAKDNNFKLSDFELTKDGKLLKGMLSVNTNKKSFSGDFNVPDPIPFPLLGDSNPTIDTSGTIQGELKIEGSGFEMKKSSATAKLSLTHAKGRFLPLTLSSTLKWKNGVIDLEDTKIAIKDGNIFARGTINIPSKKIDIKFDAENVPLDGVFQRFYDVNFHPIYGRANAKATFTGWGKDFRVLGEADTTGDSGYFLISTDHAHATVDVNYNEFNLDGDIAQKGKRTGDIKLKIKYGKKVKDEPRPKHLHLEANVLDNDLSISFEKYQLKGIGNGRLVMDGPIRSYTGKLNATIDNGSFAGISFQKITSAADMTYKKIKFTDAEFIMPNMQPVNFLSPLFMDFVTGGFHMHGKPIDGVVIDTDFKSANNVWSIKNITYHDLVVNGTFAPKGTNNLNLAGTIDSNSLTVFKEQLRDAKGPITGKLRVTGTSSNPLISGKIMFDDNSIYPRQFGRRFDHLAGELDFEGHTISTGNLTGEIEDGNFSAKGMVQLDNFSPDRFDIVFVANNLRYTEPDRTFRMEFDTSVTWKGTKNSSEIAGDLTILDGKYTKDFVIIEGLSGASKKEPSGSILESPNTHLNLKINNTGDLSIRNNVGDIWLKANLVITGTAAKPMVDGAVETTEGELHYLGRDFIVTQGFMEFSDPYITPYLEVIAEHEVPNIPDLVITATLHGRTNNLTLDLTSTKPLEKRDIVSLLLFGATEQEMRDTQWSTGLGPSVVANQVSTLLERPVSKFAHLDIFRLEAASGKPVKSSNKSQNNMQISRIFLGKQLTDRLAVEFVSDINTEDAQQTIRTEYTLTDYLLIKGEQSTGMTYDFGLSLRFRER